MRDKESERNKKLITTDIRYTHKHREKRGKRRHGRSMTKRHRDLEGRETVLREGNRETLPRE